MRILYVAKHGSGGNDDEGAIAYALEQLGHKIVKVPEVGKEILLEDWNRLDQAFDLCLFHKWGNVEFIKRIKCPKVFWFFDLVDWPHDLTLSSRCEARKRWMAEVVPLVDLGFCTDGDWVERYNREHLVHEPRTGKTYHKLHVLRQGADERVVGFGREQERDIDVLFTGGAKGCGVQRESFVLDLKKRYGTRFHWAVKTYREELRDLVARSKVVVCPDSPVTDRYWSNRVYVMGGFGGCVVHPDAREFTLPVAGYYNKEDRNHLFKVIDRLLANESVRRERSEQLLACVKREHLYRHRCEELVRVVKERLGI